jgi:hypothetical protein
LAPSDYNLFSPLKHHLDGKRFAVDDEAETDVRKQLRQQSKDLYAAVIKALRVAIFSSIGFSLRFHFGLTINSSVVFILLYTGFYYYVPIATFFRKFASVP